MIEEIVVIVENVVTEVIVENVVSVVTKIELGGGGDYTLI
jgi:hypothetical protein